MSRDECVPAGMEAGDETEFRDGLHGGLVWAVAVLISAVLVFATASLAVRTGADVAGKVTAGATSRTNSPMDTVLDAILRPGTGAQSQMWWRRPQMRSDGNYPVSWRAQSPAVLYLPRTEPT